MNDVVRPEMPVTVALGGNTLIKHGERGTVDEHEHNARETADWSGSMISNGHKPIISSKLKLQAAIDAKTGTRLIPTDSS